MPVAELINVSAGYGDKTVLREVSLSLEAGDFLGVIGPNGCGKTTLLRTMTGVIRPSAGRVTIWGKDVLAISRVEIARRVALVSQDISLGLPFSAFEVVMMGRTPHLYRLGRETSEDAAIVEDAMRRAEVASLADRPVNELSGGERQRVFIAMALAQKPELMLLDEPTNHLDVGHQLSVLDLFLKLNKENGLTVAAVLHDLNLALEYCKRIALMKDGIILAEGAPEQVITEKLILEAYDAKVNVGRNPVSGKPMVILSSALQSGPAVITPQG
ncbi:MAG TPA: ABC transporter ATP-binding protein [Candidatus Brocadiia bacterium]|nr:ABC transporter ATP-binding protein [Candidatus Brocadiia bacterium]